MQGPSSVSVDLVGGRQAVIGWMRNRLHFHPRVFRLTLEGFEYLPDDEVEQLVGKLFYAALDALAEHDPLVLRVTLDMGVSLTPHLRKLGFLDARGVHVVTFGVSDVLGREVRGSGAQLRLVSLSEALAAVGEQELLEVWTEAYGRAARLDPATPSALVASELRDLFLGEDGLATRMSVCAFFEDRLVGVCPAYRSGDALEVELGAVGVRSDALDRHTEISLAMVHDVAERAARQGVRRLIAEVDADAPLAVYPFADLPGRVTESLQSLMYVPRWAVGTASS